MDLNAEILDINIQISGIVKEKPNNLFVPKANATRAEASVVLENISKLYIKQKIMHPI